MTYFLPVLHLMTSALRRHLDPPDGVPAQDPIRHPFLRDRRPEPEADPGDHPALRRLSPRELADLPFSRPAGKGGSDQLGEREPQTPVPDDLRPAA